MFLHLAIGALLNGLSDLLNIDAFFFLITFIVSNVLLLYLMQKFILPFRDDGFKYTFLLLIGRTLVGLISSVGHMLGPMIENSFYLNTFKFLSFFVTIIVFRMFILGYPLWGIRKNNDYSPLERRLLIVHFLYFKEYCLKHNIKLSKKLLSMEDINRPLCNDSVVAYLSELSNNDIDKRIKLLPTLKWRISVFKFHHMLGIYFNADILLSQYFKTLIKLNKFHQTIERYDHPMKNFELRYSEVKALRKMINNYIIHHNRFVSLLAYFSPRSILIFAAHNLACRFGTHALFGKCEIVSAIDSMPKRRLGIVRVVDKIGWISSVSIFMLELWMFRALSRFEFESIIIIFVVYIIYWTVLAFFSTRTDLDRELHIAHSFVRIERGVVQTNQGKQLLNNLEELKKDSLHLILREIDNDTISDDDCGVNDEELTITSRFLQSIDSEVHDDVTTRKLARRLSISSVVSETFTSPTLTVSPPVLEIDSTMQSEPLLSPSIAFKNLDALIDAVDEYSSPTDIKTDINTIDSDFSDDLETVILE
ncbi:hypothetical protein PCE1_004947 [Barthelona sp. PCE]